MKRMLKKSLALILALTMVLGAAPLAGFVGIELPSLKDVFADKAEAATYGVLTYEVSNGKVTITDCDQSASGALDIPSTINGYSVTSIGGYAFYKCTGLTSITIPDSVTSIGWHAFDGCTGLTSVIIGNGVTSISDSAFEDCDRLTSVTIPDSVTSIGESAFRGCTGLTSIAIPDSVTSIGSCAFYYCTGLTSVTIPDSVTRIGAYAFSDCAGLTNITIPDSVTSIDYEAFRGCSGLTSITIPDSVTSIGYSAFRGCIGLTSITLPDSVTFIGVGPFAACENLTTITVDENNQYYSNDDYGVLFNKDKTQLIQYPVGNKRTTYTIPDSVTRIGADAFHSCTGLTSIAIPNSVTSIVGGAFENCTRLTSVTIGNGVTSIGYSAFRGCTGLTSITIGNGVTSIGYSAFRGCTGLTSITLPDSVTSIEDRTFEYCIGLTDVYYAGTEEEWNTIIIDKYNECLTNANIHYNVQSFASGTGIANVNKMDDKFTITMKQNGYDQIWLEGVIAELGSKTFYPDGSVFTISREVFLNSESDKLVLKRDRFRDYIIPVSVLNSMSDGDNLDVYMQWDEGDGKPYISSVFGKNSLATEYQDWVKTPTVAETDNNYDVILSAVGLDSDVTYYICQNSLPVVKNKTGVFSSVYLYSLLSLDKTVYAYACDSTGKMTGLERINLSKSTDDGSLRKMLNMSKYSLGGTGGVTIKVPDENPIFGNSQISLKAFSAPITVYYDTTNNTYIGTIGFNLYSYTLKDKTVSNASGSLTKFGDGETKKAFQNFKESLSFFNNKPFAEDEKDKNGKSYKKQWNSFVNRCKTASSYSQEYNDKNFSTDFLGYIEFTITDQGFVVKEASLKVGAEFSYSYTYQGAVWVIPTYFEATLGASASLEGSGKRAVLDKSIPFEYEITLDVEPALALEGGVGVEKLAKLGVEAKGTAPIKVEFLNQHFTLAFHGEINLKTKAFIFSWDKKLLEGDVNIVDQYWNETQRTLISTQTGVPQYTVTTNADGTAKLVEYYNESSYVSERDYLDEMSSWYGNVSMNSRTSVMSDINIKQLQTSVLEDGKPAVISVGDKVLMAWIEDCAERDTYNRMRLVYSVYDGVTWSEPVAVYDDGKNDDAPVLATDGTNVYFAWQKINAVLDENSVVTEALQQVDICTATYSSTTNSIVDAKVICTNNGYDYCQTITVENGNPVIYFASCTDPSVAVSFNNKINKWSNDGTHTLVSSLSFVLSISANGSDMSYVLDTDGDLSTSNDINVFSYSNGYSTAYDKQEVESALVGSYYAEINGQKVMFVTDGANIYYELNGERKTVFASGQNLSSLNLIERNGSPAFIWTEDNGNGNNICYVHYDGSKWTKPIVIYQAEGYYFDSLDMVDYNNNLIGAFMQDILTYDENKETNVISKVNLAYITISDYSDVSVGCATVDEETLVPGKNAPVCVYIENNGTMHINDVEFVLSDSIADNQSITLDVDLAPGENKNVYIDYAVPENFRQTTLTVSAQIADDSNINNNSSDILIGVPDLRFIKCSNVIDGKYYIVTANVGNDSVTPARNIRAKLYINENEGDLFYESVIKSLASDEIGIVQFRVRKDLLVFDGDGIAKMYCLFEDEDSKYGKTVTECIVITNPNIECAHPITEDRDKIDATYTEVGHEAGVYCIACEKYVSGGEIIPILNENTYDVSFILEGKIVSKETYKFGETISIPLEPTKPGYTFTGWTPTIPETMPAHDLTFNATWSANSYNAVFDANGGVWSDGSTEKIVITAFDSQIIVPEIPTKQGYIFSRWSPDVGVMDSVDGKTFVAEWIPATDTHYTVETYTMNTEGEYEKSTQVFSGVTGETVTAKYNVPVGFIINSEKSVFNGAIAADNSLVLKVYVDRNAYTLTTVVDGVSTPTAYLYGSKVSEPISPSKTDYKFIKWDGIIPETMPAENVIVTAVFEKCYVCPDCGNEILGEDAIGKHIATEEKAKMKATIKIKNNTGSKTISYGETLRLTAIATDMPENAKIEWYVDGIKKGEGETFEVSPKNGSIEITVKIVDSNGNILIDKNGNEISDSERVSVKSGLWQKIVSFFKNLFRMNRTVVQAIFKGII